MPQAYFTRSEERISLKKALATASAFSGGDGGNRNRVRKSIPASFYERSLSFEIPLRERRQTGSLLRYPLDHDELQGYSFIHVHC